MRRFLIALLIAAPAGAQTTTPSTPRETPVTQHASGTFEVRLAPQSVHAEAEGALGRMSIDKQFQGGLEAHSRGEMLMTGGADEGSGGYVAIERVTGSIGGRSGSFALMHFGTMQAGGETRLRIEVSPGSGTGELRGISGTMNIIIEGRQHSYTFDYTLPSP